MRKLLLLFYIIFSFTFSGELNSDHFKNLKFRFIGPDGNRAIAAAGVSSDHNTYYIGAASGGLWRTQNNGISWQPIFDDQDVSSVSALAVYQKNPKVIWAGTGETFLIRPAHAIGNGIYKSTDGGDTWAKMGLEKTARIARIVTHPDNEDIVYVAALGHTHGPQKERGIYRTMDGGNSWNKVLFVDENTGGIDIAWVTSRNDSLFNFAEPLENRPEKPVDSFDFSIAETWEVDDALHAGPVLMHEGKIRVTSDEEVFFGSTIPNIHPRTAAGYRNSGELVLLVVDGRQIDSRGVDLQELAILMRDLGCVEAINLDGGGSSAMVVDGKLLNRPAGTASQREVMSAIAVSVNN